MILDFLFVRKGRFNYLFFGLLSFLLTIFFTTKIIRLNAQTPAPSSDLLMSASSSQIIVGNTTDIGIGMNTNGRTVSGVDVVVNFDNNLLDVVGISLGAPFKTIVPGTNNVIDPTKAVQINSADPTHSIIDFGLLAYDPANNLPTAGLTGSFDPLNNPLATITFRAKSAGQATLSFIFDGNNITTDSNIVSDISGTPSDVMAQPGSALIIGITDVPSPTPTNISSSPTPTGIPSTPTPTPVPGDMDGNGYVNIFDYNSFVAAFNTRPGNIHWDLLADFNKDNIINIFDYNLLVSNFGK